MISLLIEGLGWRIGNGCSVWCTRDKWIPKDNGFIHPVCLNDATPDFKVCDLIDHTTRSWNLEKLAIFDRATKDAILSIPLATCVSHDNLFWGLNKDSRYSTKSGYWVGRLGLDS